MPGGGRDSGEGDWVCVTSIVKRFIFLPNYGKYLYPYLKASVLVKHNQIISLF